MTLSRTLQAALIIPLCASTVVVTKKHVLCSDIQTQDGFQFPYDRPAGAEIFVHHGKTTIASWGNGKDPELLPEVIRLDNISVITKTCRDLLIKVSTFDKGVREHWWNFTTTEGTAKPVLRTTGNPVTPGSQVKNTQFQKNTTEPISATPGSQTANHGWIAYLLVVPLIIGLLFYGYWSWRQKNFLWPCNALKRRFSRRAERSVPAETSLEEVVATHPSDSGENGGAQDSPHGSVHVVRIPPRCDHANSLDHKLGNEEFQPTANGHLNISDIDIASHHGDMNRVDILDAESEPLVNRGGKEQDHVSRCSATPEHGVESKPRVKNFGDY